VPWGFRADDETPLPRDVDRRQRIVHRVGPVAVAEVLPPAGARHHVVKVRLHIQAKQRYYTILVMPSGILLGTVLCGAAHESTGFMHATPASSKRAL
jgi:hypothetical protein